MTVSTAAPEVTFQVQFSYEATTLDYLSPLWYDAEGEVFESEEVANAAVTTHYADDAKMSERRAWRVKTVRAPRPETGYVDPFLEAEFAANRQYWADRAAAARNAERAQALFVRNYGPGNTVRVVKGRKVPLGTEGEVFWLGDKGWGYSVGIKTAEGAKHFTAVKNVESLTAASEEEVA